MDGDDRPKEVVQLSRGMVRRFAYSMIMVMVSVLVVGGICIWYTNYSIGKNNEYWCKLMVPLDERNQQIPQRTDEQKRFGELMHQLRIDLKC